MKRAATTSPLFCSVEAAAARKSIVDEVAHE